MLAEIAWYIQVIFFLGFLLFWPGYVLQRVFIDSDDALEVLVFSVAFSLAFLAIICLVLDVIWNVSLLSVSCTILLLSLVLFFRRPHTLSCPEKWEILIIMLILVYGFLLRSYTLFDVLPEGQDAWRHLSFIDYIHKTHTLPQFLPWAEPKEPVTIRMYPPGSHCIAALLFQPLPSLSFNFAKVFFIALGTGSALSSYVVFRNLLERKVALLSTLFVAVFIPHMGMTTEVTAQAVSIFMYPLVLYLFYREKLISSGILLGGVMIIHHFTTLTILLPLFSFAVLCACLKNWKYVIPFFGVSGIAAVLSALWWLHRPFSAVLNIPEMTRQTTAGIFFNSYIRTISPIFVVLSMAGFYILLKERKKHYLLLIVWVVTLFVASQPVGPIKWANHRFLAFLIFPCSVMASLGLLKLRKRLKKTYFVLLILIVFLSYPPHFWSTTGEENLLACEWIEDSTLDCVFHVYGGYYTFIYPLSHRKLHRISDFDDPFSYEGEKTIYFYDDASWIPHDVDRFGQFDRLYSCSGVTVYRIE